MPTLQKLTTDLIKGEVHRFWTAFSNKKSDELMEFYAPEASVFGSSSTRPEPGRLAAARRQREYFHAKSTLRATPGMIDVILLGDHAAVASYTFTFHASKVASGLGAATEEDIRNGRATQVFAYDPDGKLRIVHEHLSHVDKG
ncbi:MAG TPA: nuclear transport factor 2 family protein [Terriglobales bacterium]|nr:nuclear transport factor 2 family protein [Terriglobales bacterium]